MLYLGVLTIPSYCHGNMYQVNNNGLIILLHTKLSRYFNVPGKCLEVLGRGIFDRMKKTKEQSVMIACVMTCLGLFMWMKKYFFFFTWREALFCFQQVAWQRLLTSQQWTEICLQDVVVAAWNVASSQIMEFIAVTCWLAVQQGYKYVILAPLHMYLAITRSISLQATHVKDIGLYIT